MISNRSNLPGDLKSLEVSINDKNITTFVTQSYIFLSVLEPTWNCQLFVNDTNNLIANCPIKQGSKIKIEVETDIGSKSDGKRSFNFIVTNIMNRNMVNSKHYTYEVQGVSEEFLKNQGSRVSQVYKNQSPTNIIKKIITDILKAEVDKVDNCDNTITHTFTNTSPFDCAYQMCKVGVVSKAADLLLFQTDDKKFSLRSIEKLYNDENSKLEFIMKPSHYRDESGNIEGDSGLVIIKHNWEHYDVMANTSGGMTANKTVSFDFVSKTWTEKVFKYGNDVEEDAKNKQWEDEELFESENMNISFHPINKLMTKDDTIYDSIADWSGSRRSSLMKLENDKLLIQVAFTAKASEALAKNCEITIPAVFKDGGGNDTDEFSGKFLITSICIILSPKGAFANYELIKKRIEKKNTSTS